MSITLPGTLPISIHALREERDIRPRETRFPLADFNPRAPRGARPWLMGLDMAGLAISIH